MPTDEELGKLAKQRYPQDDAKIPDVELRRQIRSTSTDIAENLARDFPATFHIVHMVNRLSEVSHERHNFVFRNVSRRPVLNPDYPFRNGYSPQVAMIYLAWDGGWPRTLLRALLAVLGITSAFELLWRLFYYIVSGSFRPHE